jgi:hypothetical protein
MRQLSDKELPLANHLRRRFYDWKALLTRVKLTV